MLAVYKSTSCLHKANSNFSSFQFLHRKVIPVNYCQPWLESPSIVYPSISKGSVFSTQVHVTGSLTRLIWWALTNRWIKKSLASATGNSVLKKFCWQERVKSQRELLCPCLTHNLRGRQKSCQPSKRGNVEPTTYVWNRKNVPENRTYSGILNQNRVSLTECAHQTELNELNVLFMKIILKSSRKQDPKLPNAS